jgi:hypothetical protein
MIGELNERMLKDLAKRGRFRLEEARIPYTVVQPSEAGVRFVVWMHVQTPRWQSTAFFAHLCAEMSPLRPS